MADEIHSAGVCGGEWLNSFGVGGRFGPTLCSSIAIKDMACFGWPNHHDLLDIGASGSCFREQGSSFISPGMQVMGMDLPSSTVDPCLNWNHELLQGTGTVDDKDDSSDVFNPKNQQGFSVNQQFITSLTNECLTDCQQDLSSGSPMNSGPFDCTSTWLFDSDSQLENLSMNYPTINQTKYFDEFSPYNLPAEIFPSFPNASTPRQQNRTQEQFSSNTRTASWVPSPAGLRPSLHPPSESQLSLSALQQKTNSRNLNGKRTNELIKAQDSGSIMTKNSSQPILKRLRIETSSPLPTFKVRKEKLGDRITALQQLVSPFGKTDTASVLHEAIEYIKFLHDQVNVLSAQSMKNGAPFQHQQNYDSANQLHNPKQDLKSRGLCLLPISITFPVAADSPSDFWTPKF